jgi:hypothetical protein
VAVNAVSLKRLRLPANGKGTDTAGGRRAPDGEPAAASA